MHYNSPINARCKPKTNKMNKEAEKKAKELYPEPYIRGMATRFATELKDSITLRRRAFIEGANWQAQSEWVNADKLAEIIVLSLDAYARSVDALEYGLPIDPDTKSFDDPLAMDLKAIVMRILPQPPKTKNK